ncbi:MAG: hypothetical protein WD532_09160 [Acidimicrobiia bacterium]
MSDRRFERVEFLDEAIDDLRTVASRSPAVLREVFRLLKRLDAGSIRPQPLNDFTKTGDLTDCGKIVVTLPGEPEHRIVVRFTDGTFHVFEVVAVENRTQDLPYLLAGLRLERIRDPIRKSEAHRRVARIRRLLDE